MTSLTSTSSRTAPSADPTPPRRGRFWRSPPDQPRWARPGLLGIAALAALLYAWNITSSGFAPYYSLAARSMSESWKAFLFTTVDPSATLTMDKIGGFLWPQALSARIFGFHDWALTLPQCVMGVISVLVMYRLVRRWQGPAAGLLASGLLTVTPVAASMFGHAMPDGSLTMCLVLAADQYQKAVGTARLRPLLLSALWIGIGFQMKMMQAWIAVPAFFIGYLVAAPVQLRKRLGRLAVAGVVLFSVSLSWVALLTFTPKDDRPYVDASTNNSAVAMVFGYNGFDRMLPGLIDGGGFARPGDGGEKGGAGRQATAEIKDGGKGERRGEGRREEEGEGKGGEKSKEPGWYGPDGGQQPPGKPGPSDWFKLLLDSRFTPQIGWLYPLALCALAFGFVRHRAGPRTDQARTGYLMWGVWLAAAAGVLSALFIPHTAYVASLAPPLAALSAAGTVALWRAHRAATGGWRAWTLPAVIVAEAGWTVHLASDYTDFAPWLIPVVVVGALAALVSVTVPIRRSATSRPSPAARRLGSAGLLAGCLAMFAAPAAWSLSVLDERHGGSAFDASAGPAPAGVAGRVARNADTSMTADQSKLLAYVQKHGGSAKYTLSAETRLDLAPYIYAEAPPVLPLTGRSLTWYRERVASGEVSFALVTKEQFWKTAISAWVESACAKVDPRTYGADPDSAADADSGRGRDRGKGSSPTLYHCTPGDADRP
ncbi:mannosyl transferase [Streptomyces sp. WAC 01529]|uniref:ArnT family glycosyltransferase n=1 Tax=Streptomyces sp. WAC 01529 TaxID=2203205 RepID=UPI000F6C24DB|nr:glycosyltransferase family 39 protein [Streptomyces sp. WAC 01529]AZM56091.1 mannosyl transferase [Streptomyces sp. WAC 01529]